MQLWQSLGLARSGSRSLRNLIRSTRPDHRGPIHTRISNHTHMRDHLVARVQLGPVRQRVESTYLRIYAGALRFSRRAILAPDMAGRSWWRGCRLRVCPPTPRWRASCNMRSLNRMRKVEASGNRPNPAPDLDVDDGRDVRELDWRS